uniref:Uncharacterized protein n=1 Tax=Helianthus annuus TaxID=4232 RepID=A0A251UTM4_HELAN
MSGKLIWIMYSAIHDIDEEPNVKDGERMLLRCVCLPMIIGVTSGVDYFHTYVNTGRKFGSPPSPLRSPPSLLRSPPRLRGLYLLESLKLRDYVFGIADIRLFDGGCGPLGTWG